MAVRVDQRDQILGATDLVHLIGEAVALKARGREYMGLCPFHDDKRPSLHVSPAKQIYKCFSCGAGGTAFDFMINYHKMTFIEALKFLADRAGIALEGSGAKGHGPREEEGPTDRQLIAEANARAVGFFRTLLRHAEHGKVARAYIDKRGINPDMVEAFQIGYAPDRWDGLAMTIQQNNWNRRGFELAGLISPRGNSGVGSRVSGEDSGVGSRVSGVAENDVDGAEQSNSQPPTPDARSFYDRLRHRLIFPICDQLGRPIAFGGRKLREEDEPKYLNSPETALFNKSATLFGINLAKKAIIDSKTAVIVEGYTDVIACHQAGVANVVATLGTALTMEHVTALRRFAEKVVLIFDADEAGQKAADRGSDRSLKLFLELFLHQNRDHLDVMVAVLPYGKDPAELFGESGGDKRWQEAIDQAKDILAFQFERMCGQFATTTTLTGRQRLVEEYLRKLADHGLAKAGPIRRAMVIQRLSELLHMDEGTLNNLLRKFTPRNALAGPVRPSAETVSTMPRELDNGDMDVAPASMGYRLKALQKAEAQLIGALLRYPAVFHETLSDGRTLDEAITASDMATAAGALLYQRIHDHLAGDHARTLVQLLGELASENQQALVQYATRVEAEMEQLDGADEQRGREVARLAAECLLRFQSEQSYAAARQAFAAMKSQANPTSQAEAQQIRDLQERARANQSPIRIKRISAAT